MHFLVGLWCNLRRAAWLGSGLLLASLSLPSLAESIELRAAQASVTIQGVTSQQAVSLPYDWDRYAEQAGEATLELPFELKTVPLVPFGLYISRIGNAYEIWLNDTLLQRNGDLLHYNGSDLSKAPRHILISPGLLRTNNVIRVRIRADLGRNGGLAPLILGPDEEVYPLYLHDYNTNITGTFVVFIFSLLVAVVALALWATQVETTVPDRPLRNLLYLFAGLAELCGALSVSDLIMENPPFTWHLWHIVRETAELGWECSMILFCVQVAGWDTWSGIVWLKRWLGLLLLALVASATGALVNGQPTMSAHIDSFSELTFLIFATVFVWRALRGASLQHRMVAVAVSLNVLADLHHIYMQRIVLSYGDHTYLRYTAVTLGLTLGGVVLLRFRDISGQIRNVVANLAVRVAQKELEIKQSYYRAEQLVRENERTAERASILRDMHDGVGSHISTAIRQLQSGNMRPDEVLRTLHESLDQLKLTIDGMNLPPGDIPVLLANLRYRLEPRLKSSDIELQWDVEPLEPLARLDGKAMRHLQFLVFEALSNVLQHAHASLLRIELHGTPQGGARLRVIDNGRGFEPERVKDRGLRSLRERAATIGARLLVKSAPGNTVVEIELD